MERLALYITRWTDRPEKPEYKAMLANASFWEGTRVDLKVCIHGSLSENVEKAEKDCKAAGVEFVTYEHAPFPRINAQLFRDILLTDYTYVGVMDDDTYIDDEAMFATFAIRAFNLFSPWPFVEVMPVGFVGPKRAYVDNQNIWVPKQKDWSCAGCQLYRVDALRETASLWYSTLHEAKRFCDNMLHVCVAYANYGTMRFYAPGYRHVRSQGVGAVYNQKWYLESLADTYHDFAMYRNALAACTHPHITVLRKEIDSAERGSIKTLNERAQKYGIRTV